MNVIPFSKEHKCANSRHPYPGSFKGLPELRSGKNNSLA